jgi:hypothetical protein
MPHEPTTERELLTRDVYAHYGLALYLAQCLEHQLVNALVYGKHLPSVVGYAKARGPLTRSDFEHRFDLFADELFDETMGGLIARLKETRKLPDNFDIKELMGARDMRNLLAHRYFRLRADDFISIVGLQGMLAELEEAQKLFSRVDTAVTDACLALADAVGVNRDAIDRYMEVDLLSRHARAAAIDAAFKEPEADA